MTETISLDLTTDALTNALRNANKSSMDWQEATGRLVSKAFVGALTPTTDDISYIRALALCKWAQSIGVTEAKKRRIDPVRFRTKEPPSLREIGIPELKLPAIELLSVLRANWCSGYISSLTSLESLDKKCILALCRWAFKISASYSSVIDVLVSPCVGSEVPENRALLILKEVNAKAGVFKAKSTAEAAIQFALEATKISEQLAKKELNNKLGTELWKMLAMRLEQTRSAHPVILIEPRMLQTLQLVSANLIHTPYAKRISKLVEDLLEPTLSSLDFFATQGGKDGMQYAKLLLPSLESAFKGMENSLNESVSCKPRLATLDGTETQSEGIDVEDFAANVYARLLPSWCDFYDAYPEADELTVLNSNILAAAAFNGIEFLGKTGDVVEFDSLAHRLSDASFPLVSSVRIVRPALIFRRANGSYRIILPGIVEP